MSDERENWLRSLRPESIEQHIDDLLASLSDSNARMRVLTLETLGKLEPSTLAQHAAAVAARLEDSVEDVRYQACETLGKLEPSTLAQHAAAVVAILEDSARLEDSYEDIPVRNNIPVREAALNTLGKLEPAALAQHANAVLMRLWDSCVDGRTAALNTLRHLPKVMTRNVGFDSSCVRRRLLGRLAWYKCRLRLRVKRLALYWYALPYRPSGPGHARDVVAWDQMSSNALPK